MIFLNFSHSPTKTMGNFFTNDNTIIQQMREFGKIHQDYLYLVNDDFLKRNWRFFDSHAIDVLSGYHSCFSEECLVHYLPASNAWNWSKLSQKDVKYGSYFSCQFITDHSEFPWDWKQFTYHPDIVALIHRFPNKPFDWDLLSLPQSLSVGTGEYINSTISLSFIEKYPSREWNWSAISRFASEDFINNNLNKPWDFAVLSNRNLTIPFILKHKHQLTMTKNIENILEKATESFNREQRIQENLKILERMLVPCVDETK